MIVLSSNGLSSNKLIDRLKEHIKIGKAALVVTADNEYKENNYHVDRLTTELKSLGLSVDYFDFDKQTPTELMQYDVVELMGGNPYYLLDSIHKNSFLNVLEYFAQNKCLIGCSAGSIVLSPSLDLIDIYSAEMNIVNLCDLSACNIANVRILPHYSKYVNKYDDFEEKCFEYERRLNCNVIRLNDGEGIIIDKNNVNIIETNKPDRL